MRAWPFTAIATGLGVFAAWAAQADAPPRPAPPRPTGPVDLDATTGGGASRIAEAAGACAPGAPAHIASWCQNRPGQPARDFVKRYRSLAAAAAPGDAIRFAVPVEEAGKGLLISPIEPQIHCDAQICLYAPTVTLFVRPSSQVDAGRVASVTLALRVSGMWRARQWWGPRITGITATLWDAQDRRLGEGAVLQLTPSQ
jgi:hypothetical protein